MMRVVMQIAIYTDCSYAECHGANLIKIKLHLRFKYDLENLGFLWELKLTKMWKKVVNLILLKYSIKFKCLTWSQLSRCWFF